MTDSSRFEPMPNVAQARLDANWRGIVAELDAPGPTPIERAIRRCRVPASATRLVAATPALRRAWYVAIAVVVLVGLGGAESGDDASLFTLLVLAPLLPVLGVALAFGTSADPAHEIHVATPIHGVRLVALRAMVVLGVAGVIVTALALAGPATRSVAAVWLLPAVAVTAGTLGVMTFRPPRQAATAVAVAWLVVTLLARGVGDDPLAAFGVAGQVVAAVAACVGAAVVYLRRATFDTLEVAR